MKYLVLMCAVFTIMLVGGVCAAYAESTALDDVSLVSGERCREQGKTKYVQNKSSSKSILAIVEKSWMEKGKPRTERKSFELAPKERKEVGCTALPPSFEVRVVKFTIVSAVYN